MLPIAWYLLKVVICSGILLGYYWLLLRNKIFHSYNRFYLLATIILALSVPLIQIDIWNKTEQSKSQVIQLLQVVSSGDEYVQQLRPSPSQYLNATNLMTVVYLAVSMIFLIGFIHVLWTIRSLVKKYQHRIVDNIWFVNTDARGTPFSFLRYIFWNEKIDIESQAGNQIFRHEVAHVQEKHSHDKIFLNFIMILFWCNPFFWLIRKELNMIHEFIADKKAVEDSDTAAFAAMILATAYPQHRFQLTNNFFYSPIKRRILMLTKNKNPKVNYLGRVLVLPLAVLVFAAFTFKTRVHSSLYNGKQITVVIDAGHGGTDAGAISSDGSTKEKDLNLAIVKKIKELNTNDKINIILTREDDSYQSPQEKATFSNQQHADLFISFHVDNGPKETANTKTGMHVWVAKDGSGNVANSKALASTIISTFSKDYGLSVMESIDQREKGIWVLQASSCPAVLIESGYINNEKDLAYLKTSAAKETIAKNILSAIEKFALARNQSNEVSIAPTDTVPNKNTQPTLSLTQRNDLPIYVLDGKEIDSMQAKTISPNDILSINVIKGKNAIDKYGAKAKGGVIEIKTKKSNITGMYDNAKFTDKNQEVVVVGVPIQSEVKPVTAVPINTQVKSVIEVPIQSEVKTVIGVPIKTSVNPVIEVPIHTDVKTNVNSQINVNANSTIDANVNVNTSENKVFTKVEQEPRFPGTSDGWNKYLVKNLDAAMPVKEGWGPGTYKVMLQYIVHKNGEVSDVIATNYQGSKTAQHCIDLIKNGPKWEPAIQNGKPVDAYKKQPITFVIEQQ